MKHDSSYKVAHLMTLDDIFEGRFFLIPDYQRGYSWEQIQIKDLLNDIEHLGNTDYIHFTGTIVASLNEDGFFEIVDGQQRLTTLVIIIHECLHRKIKNKKLIIERYSKIGNIGNEKQKFITNAESKDFFDHVIINNNTKTLQPSINSHHNILKAKKIIKKWLNKQNDVNGILNTVCTRLGFIFYTPKHSKEIGIMFEVINNRGKPLSQLEKIKNFLIYYSVKMDLSNLHDAVNNKWGTILRNLSLANKSSSEDETNFLRYCWLVYFDKGKKKSHDVYAELKKRFPFNNYSFKDDIKKENFNLLNNFINFLELSSKNYEQYFNEYSIKSEDDKVQSSIAKTLKSLKSQGTYASIMPLVLAIMAKATDEEQVILLDIIEKLNFRVYILPNVTHRADSGQGDLFGYAFKFYHEYDAYREEAYIEKQNGEEIKYNNIIDWLENKLKEFTEYFCPDEELKESLINQDARYNFYKWRGLRYFLMSYEEFLNRKKTIDIEKILLGRNDKKVNDYYSIEHYWAIKNRNQEGKNNREKDKLLKNRLGNLGLLEMGINIQAGDKDLSKKLKIYFGKNESKDSSDLKQIAKVKEVFEKILKKYESKNRTKDSYYYSMYKEFIESMEEEYVSFALNRWQLK